MLASRRSTIRLLLPTASMVADTPPKVAEAGWRRHCLQGDGLGTRWSVLAYAPPAVEAGRLRAAVDEALARGVSLFSNWTADSELARFNAAAAGTWVFSDACRAVIASSLALSEATQGAVDPTLGALVDLWGFGAGGPRDVARMGLPSVDAIAQVRGCSGWHRLRVDEETGRTVKPAGLRLDLCGIAKGWVVDQVSAALVDCGAKAHLVEIGGELKARGLKPDLQPWWVDLESVPGGGGCSGTLRLALVEGALATSGDYRRSYTWQGRRYAHTLDGRTGYPVNNGVAAVSVWHREAMIADAYATAILVLGRVQGMALAERLQLPVRLCLRQQDGVQEYLSSAMAAMAVED